MNAAKLRDVYQQTQVLVSELQSSGAHSYGSERTTAKLQQLLHLAAQMKNGPSLFSERDLQAIWTERFNKLHVEMVAVSALVLQNENQSGEQFWDGIVKLLYMGAESLTEKEAEIAALSTKLQDQMREASRLRESTESNAQEKESSAKENLELRTRVLVLQQEIQRKDGDSRNHQQQWQATVRERDALRQERDSLSQECVRHMQAADRQTKVIAHLMERSEMSIKERDEAVNTLKQVDEDNHTLRVNLHQHTLVVEKMIGLNAELMESMNLRAVQCEKAQETIKQLQSESVQSRVSIEAENEASCSVNSASLLDDTSLLISAGEGEKLPLLQTNHEIVVSSSFWAPEPSAACGSGHDVEIPVSTPPEGLRNGFSHRSLLSGGTEVSAGQEPGTGKEQQHGNPLDGRAETGGALSLASAKGLLKGVGGTAKNFLFYVAGADVANQ